MRPWAKCWTNLPQCRLLVVLSITVVAVAIVGASAEAVGAQSSHSTERIAFDVASVKENRSSDYRNAGIQFRPGGRLVIKGIPLMLIITVAYGLPLQSDRLTGGPEWIRTAKYDIEAAADKEAIPTGASLGARNENIRLMLQTLLAERFGLRLRRETKEVPVYAIIVKQSGPKLAKSPLEERDCTNSATSPAPGDPEVCHTFAGGAFQGVHAKAASMSDLVSWMSNWLDRPVVDKTGLDGLFNIQTEAWSPMRQKAMPRQEEAADDAASAPPTVFQVFDRLGLKLDSQRGPVEFYVIESVQRPQEN
jgi:uncharacterized protein (TIGR03435 family)